MPKLEQRRLFSLTDFGTVLALCLFCACALPGNIKYRPDIPLPARDTLDDALDHLSDGETEVAAFQLEKLVGRYPGYVDAHRHLQNLYMADNRYGYLANRYRESRDKDPDNPAFHYLYGRLLSNREHRLEAFSRSIDLDRSFFWGYNGLGYGYLSLGDFDESEDSFWKALQSEPSRIEPKMGIITLYLLQRKFDQAGAFLPTFLKRSPEDLSLHMLWYQYIEDKEGPLAATQAMLDISRNVPLDSGYFFSLLKRLDKGLTDELLRRVLYRFSPLAEGEGARRNALNLLLGVCCRKIGNISGALRYFSRVHAESVTNIRVRRELRYLYTISGRISEAFAVYTADCPADWIEENRLNERRETLCRLADRIEIRFDWTDVSGETCELAAQLMELGWLDEAAHYLAFVADLPSKEGLRARAMLDEIYRHGNFELALGRYFLKMYRNFAREGAKPGVDEVLEQLGALSKEILGRNIFEDPVFIDFSPVGVLMDPRPSSHCGPAEYFRRYNRFFLIGQKMGGPVEAYLTDLFSYVPDMKRSVEGLEVHFDLARCENLRIPSLTEYAGGIIAGAGLYSIVFINLDSIRMEVEDTLSVFERFRDREEVLLDDPPPRAEDEDEAKDMRETFGLATRLKYLSYKEHGAREGIAAYTANRFDVVLSHEIQHLVDARKFLPITANLLWSVYQFAAHGFSSFNVEAWLEERAQMLAFAMGPDPRAVLAEVADHIAASPSNRSPHRKGYGSMIRRLVEFIYDHPGQFPSIDFNANILHQLHRLTGEELHRVASALVLDEGILTAPDL